MISSKGVDKVEELFLLWLIWPLLLLKFVKRGILRFIAFFLFLLLNIAWFIIASPLHLIFALITLLFLIWGEIND